MGKKTRSLLISLAGCPRTPSDFIPDNGLALLAALLISDGHKVRVLDYNTTRTLERLFPPKFRLRLKKIASSLFEKGTAGPLTLANLSLLERRLTAYHNKVFYEIASEIAEIAEREKVDFVGLKLWNGDGFIASLIVAEVLKKKNPEIFIFGGGPQVDIFKENIFKKSSNFDALVYGDGEEAILGLAEFTQGKKELKEIPNLIFKEGNRIVTTPRKQVSDLNQLPFALYDPEVYPAMENNGRLKLIVLDESRGCPYSCYFCIHPIKSGQLRTKSPNRIVEEILYYQKRYGVSLFRYAGSNTPPALLEDVAREIIKRGVKIEYTALSDLRRRGTDFHLLKRSGCFALFFGVESANQKILEEKMNRKVSLSQMEEILKEVKKSGIFTVTSIIIPAPGETEETKEEMINFLLKTKPNSTVIQFPGIFPETEWAKEPEKFGFSIENKESYPEQVMDYKIRLFFPPRFWDPLPYRIDGKGFKEFAKETEDFTKRVEELGIDTLIADDIALMAKYAHLSPAQFRDQNRINFFTGDAENLQKMIETINYNSRWKGE